MEPRSRQQPGKDLADLRSKQQGESCQEGAAPAGDKSKGALPVAKSGRNPHIGRDEVRITVTSRYLDVVMALSQG
jgi:hypothetical protein